MASSEAGPSPSISPEARRESSELAEVAELAQMLQRPESPHQQRWRLVKLYSALYGPEASPQPLARHPTELYIPAGPPAEPGQQFDTVAGLAGVIEARADEFARRWTQKLLARELEGVLLARGVSLAQKMARVPHERRRAALLAGTLGRFVPGMVAYLRSDKDESALGRFELLPTDLAPLGYQHSQLVSALFQIWPAAKAMLRLIGTPPDGLLLAADALGELAEAATRLVVRRLVSAEPGQDRENVLPPPSLFIGSADDGRLLGSREALGPHAGREPGALIDHRYRLVEYLSAGGFGHGWVAIDTADPGCGRVFLKTMRGAHEAASCSRQELREKSRLELDTVRGVMGDPTIRQLFEQHPGLVNFLHTTQKNNPAPIHLARGGGHQNSSLDARVHFYTMELCSEGDLLGLLEAGSLPEEVCRAFFSQMASVLAAMHGRGLFHRDIKADNILLHRSSDGEYLIKVTDFGTMQQVASQVSGHSFFERQACPIMSTPWIMSPEQCEALCDGTLHDPSAADMWALGLLLLNMAATEALEDGSFYSTLEELDPADRDPAGRFSNSQLWASFPLPHLSEQCRLLVNRLLDPTPEARASAVEAEQHEWLAMPHASTDQIHGVVQERRGASQ